MDKKTKEKIRQLELELEWYRDFADYVKYQVYSVHEDACDWADKMEAEKA